MTSKITILACVMFLVSSPARAAVRHPAYAPGSANPILPGYYADPSILQYEGREYIYATIDPWGGDTLGCWESDDFKNWTYRALNWPTKKACTSPTSKASMVWAPSVVRAPDGRFYMYVSVGSEVWVGAAAHPLGPWRNVLGDRPLIPSDYKPGYHMIDAEAFIDDDGRAYLYWGSGLNWVNGRCWAARLKPDMASFDGPVHDVTPASYFEAPFMVKRHGRYFLMNSTGKTIGKTYAVQYAVGDTPFGPFTDGPGTPILSSDPSADVLSPGHHAIFSRDGIDYILYHRHSVPFDPRFVGRQVCVDVIRFGADGRIERVAPTDAGPALARGRMEGRSIALGAAATASSFKDADTLPAFAFDDNYATRWAADPAAHGAWLQVDLGSVKAVTRQLIRFEYAWKGYRYSVEASVDGVNWTELAADADGKAPVGSPVWIDRPAKARYLRLVFPPSMKGSDISLFEWAVF